MEQPFVLLRRPQRDRRKVTGPRLPMGAYERQDSMRAVISLPVRKQLGKSALRQRLKKRISSSGQ
jgi:hypothetical protein